MCSSQNGFAFAYHPPTWASVPKSMLGQPWAGRRASWSKERGENSNALKKSSINPSWVEMPRGLRPSHCPRLLATLPLELGHFEKALFWGVILHLQLHAHCPGVNSSLLWNCVWSGSPKLGIMDPIQPPLYTLGHFWAIFVTFGSAKPQARQCHCRQPVPSQCRHLGQRRRGARIKTNCHVHTETALAMSQFDGNGANECKQFSNVRKQSKLQVVKNQLQYKYDDFSCFLKKQGLLQTATSSPHAFMTPSLPHALL